MRKAELFKADSCRFIIIIIFFFQISAEKFICSFRLSGHNFATHSIHIRHLYAAAWIDALLMSSSVQYLCEQNKKHNINIVFTEGIQYLLSAKIFRMCFSHCDIDRHVRYDNNNNGTHST